MSWSRREILILAGAATVGAAAAFLPRKPTPTLDHIQGRIVGGNATLGHRLLRSDLPAPTRHGKATVVIAGAGIAGLSAAWALDRAGLDDYRVLELEDMAGGTSTWAEYAASPAPWAAHYLPIPAPEAEDVRVLLADLGVLTGHAPDGRPIYDQRHVCHAPQERLHIHGTWQEGIYPHTGASRDDLGERDAFRQDMDRWRKRIGRDGRPAFAIPVALSSSDPDIRALDEISMSRYLRDRGYKSERLRWYVEYGCRDDYGCDLDTTSAWAGVHYFASRGRGSAVDIPDTDEVLTWPEGMGWIARRLAERVGGRLTKGVLVTRVAPTKQGVEVDFLDARTQEVTRIQARHAVVALPRFVTARVVEGYASRDLSPFTYAPWVVSNLVVRHLPKERTRREAPLSWDNVFYDSPSLGYVVATHQSLRTTPGPSVLTHYQALVSNDPRKARADAQQHPWEHWRDRIMADMSAVHPGIEETVERLDVMLWGHAMVRPLPGLLWSGAREAAARPIDRIHFAHCDLSGIPIFEEAQHHGLRAARAVLT